MSIYDDTVKGLARIMAPQKSRTQPYDTPATVRRIEGGVAYVHIEGGVDETPVALTINAKAGDNVLVRVSGGRAWITGNSSAPPTDDHVAVQTAQAVEEVEKTVSNVDKSDVGEIIRSGRKLIVYDQKTVEISFEAGAIATRAAVALVGSTSLEGYTYMGADIIDHRNTVHFQAELYRNEETQTLNVVAYRVTTAAVSKEKVKVRMFWANDYIIGRKE